MERTEIIPPEVRASGFAGEEIRAEIERNTAIAAKERIKAEKKGRETLQKRLAKRKIKRPDRFIYFLYWFLMAGFIMKKYRPVIKREADINECKGPCFLIWNHLSRLDHAYMMAATYPKRISIVAGYSEFFKSHLATVFRLNRILPKKNFTADFNGIRAINSIIMKGGCVCMAPEGMSSIFGENQPVVAGTGRFIRHYRIPVYFGECRGQFLTTPKHWLEERPGRTEVTLKLLFTPEQLESMTDGEVEDALNLAFRHDDYAWGREQGIRWKMHGRAAAGLDTVIYCCPECGAEFTMRSAGDRLACEKCGFYFTVDDTYAMRPSAGETGAIRSPLDLVKEERVRVIREIREKDDFSFSFPVFLGCIPEYHLIRNKQSSELCGEGVFRIDHTGVSFSGRKYGEPFEMKLGYDEVFSPVIETETSLFAFYYKGEYYDFFPYDPRVTGKVILLTEEMHRLHVNTWKNFPWYSRMYEGLPETGAGDGSKV